MPDAQVARAYAYIKNDCDAKAATQEAIAAHNSVHATLTTGKQAVYRPKTDAECASERAKPKTEPKTS